jgi:N-acetylmuramoyl-L-alanine amidase
MAVVKATQSDRQLLARLIRAEAEGEGELGMLLVGNVGVNRVRSRCLDFKDINSIERMVWQTPGGYEAVHKPYFFQRAREKEIRLAERVIDGERFRPAEFSLWFFRPDGPCPEQWWDQWNSGKYKQHCFFIPTESDCPDVYNVY